MNELADLFGATAEEADLLNRLLDHYLVAREKEDRAEAVLRMAKEEKDRAEAALIEKLKAMGLKSIQRDDGTSVTLRKSVHFSLPSKNDSNYGFAIEWLRGNGMEEIIKETVNYQTLGATLREYEASGKEVPAFFRRFEKTQLSV